MGWNYRVMRHEDESGVAYDIHEVYYEKDGSVKNWTENGVSPMADTRDDIFLILAIMADAIGQPVLDGKTGEVVEEKRVAGESLTKALETVRDEMECSSVARLTRERDEARAVLRKVEWVRPDGERADYCQVCQHWKRDGHAADCALAAALPDLPAEKDFL